MKCVLTLVFLFHLCHSVTINKTVISEISKGLSKLDDLYRQHKLNFTSPETAKIRVPTTKMDQNVSACVGVFVRELKHLLDNVTVPENSSYVLHELMANLEEVGKHEENDRECPMTQASNLKPFSPYRAFLRTLIRKK